MLFIAFMLNGSLYGLDTSLLDLSDRQKLLMDTLNAHLLRWDTMDTTEVDSALFDAKKEVDTSIVGDKIHRAFCTLRVNDQIWYVFPMLCVAFLFVNVCRTEGIRLREVGSALLGKKRIEVGQTDDRITSVPALQPRKKKRTQ